MALLNFTKKPKQKSNAIHQDLAQKWIRSNGADPQKIIVSWGDKTFIQDQAEEWLQ